MDTKDALARATRAERTGSRGVAFPGARVRQGYSTCGRSRAAAYAWSMPRVRGGPRAPWDEAAPLVDGLLDGRVSVMGNEPTDVPAARRPLRRPAARTRLLAVRWSRGVSAIPTLFVGAPGSGKHEACRRPWPELNRLPQRGDGSCDDSAAAWRYKTHRHCPLVRPGVGRGPCRRSGARGHRRRPACPHARPSRSTCWSGPSLRGTAANALLKTLEAARRRDFILCARWQKQLLPTIVSLAARWCPSRRCRRRRWSRPGSARGRGNPREAAIALSPWRAPPPTPSVPEFARRRQVCAAWW